jgi:hypothetical protein
MGKRLPFRRAESMDILRVECTRHRVPLRRSRKSTLQHNFLRFSKKKLPSNRIRTSDLEITANPLQSPALPTELSTAVGFPHNIIYIGLAKELSNFVDFNENYIIYEVLYQLICLIE